MKKIDKGVFNNIINLIRELSISLYLDDNIECIYLTNYYVDESVSICPTILLKDNANLNEYRRKINLINKYFKLNISDDILIYCSVDYSYKYNPLSTKMIDIIRMGELKQSKILFDKNGYITRMQNESFNRDYAYDFNIPQFSFPTCIDSTLSKNL